MNNQGMDRTEEVSLQDSFEDQPEIGDEGDMTQHRMEVNRYIYGWSFAEESGIPTKK